MSSERKNGNINVPAEKQTMFSPQAKVLHHIDRVVDFLGNKKVDPINIEIDPSNACNHSCPFCISGHLTSYEILNYPITAFMTVDQAIRTISTS